MAANIPAVTDDQIKRRRQFTQKLNLRRQVYRELTSYRVFPLQEMAMNDLDEKLKDYLGTTCDSDEEDTYVVDRRCVNVSHRSAASSESRSNADGTTTDSKQIDESSDDLERLREQYRQEFLREKLMPSKSVCYVTAAAVSSRNATTSQTESRDPTLIESAPADLCSQEGNLQQSENAQADCCTSDTSEALPNEKDDASQSQLDFHLQTEATNESPCIQAEVLEIQQDGPSTFVNESESQRYTISNSEAEQEKSSSCANEPDHSVEKQYDGSTSLSQINETAAEVNESAHLPILWSMEPRIFAFETSGTGKRRYISSHLGRFMDHYWRECDVYNRHYYELIREGSPCRLYFDIEFNKIYNEDITEEIAECLLTELFHEVQFQFETLYNITIHRRHLVDLDSSTEKKFSRHWIFHLPNGELFSDARAAGVFVKLLVARLDADKESGALESKGHQLLAKYLFLNAEVSSADDKKLTRFIDLGVYTRNRLFRIMGSSKFSKRPDAALRIASANTFLFPGEFNNTKFYLPEMSALDEENNDNGAAKTSSDLEFKRFCKSHHWEDHATALEHTLVVPAYSAKNYHPVLPDPESLLDDNQQTLIEKAGIRCRVTTSGRNTILSYNAHGQSPFPNLEDFVTFTLGRRKGLTGSIGTYSLCTQEPLPRSISYSMLHNRWCENVGRAHKSNNIIWNVHLIDRICYQSCHDPECRGFRGEEIDLPLEVNAEIDEYFLDRELSSLCVNNQKLENTKETQEFHDPELEQAIRNLHVKAEHKPSTTLEDEFCDPLLEEAMEKLAL